MINTLAIMIFAINVYALLLVFLRSWIYHTKVYRPMVLNIGLSIAPIVVLFVAFAFVVRGLDSDGSPAPWIVVASLCGIIWLLLLPNSSYLITELNFSHRKENDNVPLWFDIISMLTLAMSGVLNTVFNILLLQLLLTILIYDNSHSGLRNPAAWAISLGIILLVSLGMYLGRYLRLNSWDVRHPFQFVKRLVTHFQEPNAKKNALLFCGLHAVFLILIYLVITQSTVNMYF